jgi:hypothetical protein
MEKNYVPKRPESRRLGAVFFLLLLGCVPGCGAKEPPLSPAAAAFKKEIRECIAMLAVPLTERVMKRDIPAIQVCLAQIEPEVIKLCRRCPFRLGVLDREGNTLAVHPPKKTGDLDFYRYDVVQQALKEHRITRQRLFLQDGSKLYVVCAPLLQEQKTVGILAVALSADEARTRWGLTEEEFLVIDFNR